MALLGWTANRILLDSFGEQPELCAFEDRAVPRAKRRETSQPGSTLGSLMPDLPVTSPADALGPAIQSYEEFLEDIKGRIRSA
jgi:hypothetical protein